MRMVSFVTVTLLFLIISMTLQEGRGLPVADHSVQTPHPSHIRTKRCSCNNWEDKECIYFCHLDIIWINTPGKLLPYGLGSPLSRRRRRRSAGRCECLNPADKTCHGFCHQRSEDGRNESTSTSSSKLLGFFRNVVKANVAVVKSRSPPTVKKLKNRTRR